MTIDIGIINLIHMKKIRLDLCYADDDNGIVVDILITEIDKTFQNKYPKLYI